MEPGPWRFSSDMLLDRKGAIATVRGLGSYHIARSAQVMIQGAMAQEVRPYQLGCGALTRGCFSYPLRNGTLYCDDRYCDEAVRG